MTQEQDQQMIEITASLTPAQTAACVVILTRMKNLGYRHLATSDAEAEQMRQAGAII